MTFINGGRIVGNIVRTNNQLGYYTNINNLIKDEIESYCKKENIYFTEKFNEQCVITNKNNLIYCEKDKELFLEDNNFIKNKKLISISPGGLKGFYELGILSYIKETYNMENYIFSGASAGSWNALFMCHKHDTKSFVFNLLNDYKLSQIKNINELEYFMKYKLLTKYNSDDFDLGRLFIGVTTLKQLKPVTNIFSDFNSLEDAINCCIASSHIPLITGGFTNRYHNMYTFDGGFSNYPYLNFTENVLHITPGMWKDKKNIQGKQILDRFASLNIVVELFLMAKNKNYMKMFDDGYEDAKTNKALLDVIFLKTYDEVSKDISNEMVVNKDNDSY
jgi:hypothetical protein